METLDGGIGAYQIAPENDKAAKIRVDMEENAGIGIPAARKKSAVAGSEWEISAKVDVSTYPPCIWCAQLR